MSDNQGATAASDAEKVLARLDEISASFGSRFESLVTRLDTLEKRADDDKRGDDDDKQRKDAEEKQREDRRRRHDAFKQFSRRRHDDDDAKYKARHDEEEKSLRECLEEKGEPKETASDRAKRARHDAERCADDARFFSKRRHDDDDDKMKSRRDAEEKEVAERFEKEGDSKDDAAIRAHWARSRRDEEDKEEEEKEKDKEKKNDMRDDDNKHREDSAAIEARIRESLLKTLRPEVAESDRLELVDAQTRADEVYSAFGEQAPRPVAGELAPEYQRRAFGKFKQHSSAWKDTDLTSLDRKVLNIACGQIRNDAIAASRQSATFQGSLRAITKIDEAGRKVTEFVGDPIVWMSAFMPPQRFVTKINTGVRS